MKLLLAQSATVRLFDIRRPGPVEHTTAATGRRGALATSGGLVFAGDDNGYVYVFDDRSGAILWRRFLGLRFGSAPIAYVIAGVEYIAVVAGGSQFEAPGHAPGGRKLFVFRLGAK